MNRGVITISENGTVSMPTDTVWTDPDMRRCGYARLLLTELIQDWKNDSLNNSHDNTIIPLILHVSGSNMPAVRLYKSSGFVVREELKYYNVK